MFYLDLLLGLIIKQLVKRHLGTLTVKTFTWSMRKTLQHLKTFTVVLYATGTVCAWLLVNDASQPNLFSAPCPGYFVNITCTQQNCPAPPKMATNVVGGRTANPYAWPYMVHILSDGDYLCGGVLITEHHVLTAAHCIQGYCGHFIFIWFKTKHFSFKGKPITI